MTIIINDFYYKGITDFLLMILLIHMFDTFLQIGAVVSSMRIKYLSQTIHACVYIGN